MTGLDEDPLATPVTDEELRAIMAQARTSGDDTLRRLVTSYVSLRRVMADVVTSIEAREGGSAVAASPLILRARHLARGAKR